MIPPSAKKLSPSSSFAKWPATLPEDQPASEQSLVSNLAQAMEEISLEPALDTPLDTPLNRLKHDLDLVKTSSKNERDIVDGLLLRLPNIKAIEQFLLFAETVLEFKSVPGIDRVAYQLIVLADNEPYRHNYAQDLIDCVTRPIAEQYPDPYPVDDFLKAHEGSGTSRVLELVKPRKAWGATTIGRSLCGYVPPGLVNGLMQLLPRLSADELVDLLNELRGWLHVSDKATDLFAATLARAIALIDKGASDEHRQERIEQVLARLCPTPTAKRHAIIQEPVFPGIQEALGRLTQQLHAELLVIQQDTAPRTAKTLAATDRFFSGVLALLPYIRNVAHLGLLEVAAQTAPAEASILATNYLHALNRQKLQWALGLPTDVSEWYPKVDEATNVLLLLLVTPKASLPQFAQSAQRPDIQTLDGLRAALDNITLDKPSSNDQVLLDALNERVHEVLQVCCSDDQARALVLAMIAALKEQPAARVEQLRSLVLGQLGLAQAAPPRTAVTPAPRTVSPDKAAQVMPSEHAIKQGEGWSPGAPTNAPREVVISAFSKLVEQAVHDYSAALRSQGHRKGNAHHNDFNEKLVKLVPTMSTQRDVEALRRALKWLPSHWAHGRVIDQLLLRYREGCRQQGLQAHAFDAKRPPLDELMVYLESVLPAG